MAYELVLNPKAKKGITFRGDCLSLMRSKDAEVMLSGGANTGKTIVSCAKLHLICCKYPGAQCTIVRKTMASLPGSALMSLKRVIKDAGVEIMGGDRPTKFIYPNGSVIWVGGMDNPDRVLSSERDTIYVNQAEELTLEDWEYLSTRCSGRGAIIPHPQLFGDCNPGGSRHWIRQRAASGSLRLLNARHVDNPLIYHELTQQEAATRYGDALPAESIRRGDMAYVLTEKGPRELLALQNLTGVRRKRLLEGIWATAEGAVYDSFDSTVHVCVRPDTDFRFWYMAIDEGFTHPNVTLLIGVDTDGRWHVAREKYVTKTVPEDVVAHARDWRREKQVMTTACDEAAAGLIASLNNAGVPTYPGKGRILDGIRVIQDRLKVQADGRPRLTIDPSCKELVNEMESYAWKPEKDVPIDTFNHGPDSLRYLADVLGEPTGAWSASDVAEATQAAEQDDGIFTEMEIDYSVE